MYKIGVIGDGVGGFASAGFTVHEVGSAEEAAKVLRKLVNSDEYAVVFVTEKFASQMGEEFERFKDRVMPAVIPIPGEEGNTGYGKAKIKDAVIRAVGADII